MGPKARQRASSDAEARADASVTISENVGTGKAAELATYIVEKGKPLLVPSE